MAWLRFLQLLAQKEFCMWHWVGHTCAVSSCTLDEQWRQEEEAARQKQVRDFGDDILLDSQGWDYQFSKIRGVNDTHIP